MKWLEIDASETTDHAGALQKVYRRDLDGMTVTGIFSPEHCRRAVEFLARCRDDEPIPAMFGTMLGLPLAEVARVSPDPRDRSIYLEVAQRCREQQVEAFGIDPLDRLREVLLPMSDGLRIETPAEGDRRYASGNVRWMEPGEGGLPAHVGNEFQLHGDPTGEFLRSTTDTLNHYSWFIVLQAPTEGGSLEVFDLVVESDTGHLESWGDLGRDDATFAAIPCKQVSPPAGSLVFFGGGWRWHRVAPVAGSCARVTLGGFAAPALNGQALNFWF